MLHTRELENTNTDIENCFYTSGFAFTIYVRGAIGLELQGSPRMPHIILKLILETSCLPQHILHKLISISNAYAFVKRRKYTRIRTLFAVC